MDIEDNPEVISLKESLDTKHQELYHVRMQLNHLSASMAHIEGENNELRSELDEKEREITQLKKNCLANEEQISSLNIKLKLAIEEKEEALMEKKLTESDDYPQQCSTTKITPSKSFLSTSASFYDGRMAAFQEQIAELEDEMKKEQTKCEEAVSELQRYMDENSELRYENNELKEEVECVECQLKSQCDINEHLRQELKDMKMEDTQILPSNVERKGNSLFSEVEDRRIMVEKRMVNLQEHLRKVEDNLTKEVKENDRLKTRIRHLRQASNKVHNEESVQNIIHQLEESKKKVLELTEKLQGGQKMSAKVCEIPNRFLVSESASSSDKKFYSFVESLVAQNKQDLAEEKSQHDQTKLQLAHSDLLFTQKNNELIAMTLERDRLRGHNFDLSTRIRDLQQKYEPDRDQMPTGSKENKGQHSSQPQRMSPQGKQSFNTGQISTWSKTGIANSAYQENKENSLPRTEVKESQDQKPSKKVGLSDKVDIILSDGNHGQEVLKTNGGNAKLARNGKGSGKYKSVNVATALSADTDSNVTECNQQ